jgi:nucleoside-triphosphatase THEP1
MARCKLCHKRSPRISAVFGLCLNCIRSRSQEDLEIVALVHCQIGKMELFSKRFRALVLEALSIKKPLLATIALKGERFIQEIKQRPDVHLLTITHDNRDHLFYQIIGDHGIL